MRPIPKSLTLRLLSPLALGACAWCGCGDYPEPLSSRGAVTRASPKTEMIAIADLPLQDYPLLAKFRDLTTIDFYKQGRSGADDAKLTAIASLGFQHLQDIGLNFAASVTGRGVLALSNLPSLKYLALRGTSVDDAALAAMASQMHLSGVNVAGCQHVTYKGLVELLKSESLTDIGFSASGLSQSQAADLIARFSNISYCSIDDEEGRLDQAPLLRAAEAKNVKLTIGPYQGVPGGGKQ